MNDPSRSAAAKDLDLLARPGPALYPSEPFVRPLEEAAPRVIPEGNEPKVREIMTRDVQTCRADRTLVSAGNAMHRGDCRFLPVVDDQGRPIAVITDGDICEIGSTDHRPLRDIRVSEAMSREVFTCRPDDGVRQVLETMKRRRIRHLPVVDGEGLLLGVVSLTDVMLHIVERGGETAEALRGEIAEVLRFVSQKERGTRSVQVSVSTSSTFWTSSTWLNAAANRSAAYTRHRRCQRSSGCA